MTSIHTLHIHESVRIITSHTEFTVTRVAGGWIYVTYTTTGVSSVFVPYSDRFSPQDNY